MNTLRAVALLLGCSLLALASQAAAQVAETKPKPPTSPNDESASVAEVIVTATRREANIQSIPVAVDVITGEQINRSAYKSLTDLQYLDPSVLYNPNNAGGYQIRGVGTQSFDYSLEQSVSIVVDGVVFNLPRSPSLNSLTDVDRIEVLKGPQGTLFGKNASAGVINVITRRPRFDKVSDTVHAAIGESNDVTIYNNANLPISSYAAAAVSVFYQGHDSYAKSAYEDRGFGNNRDYGVRGKLLLKPKERLEVYILADFQQHRDNEPGGTFRSLGPAFGPLLASVVVPGPENEIVTETGKQVSRNTNWGGSVEADYDLGDAKLTSVTAYRRLHYSQWGAADGTAFDILDSNHARSSNAQFSQELRIASSKPGFLDYVAGLYYLTTNTRATQDQFGADLRGVDVGGVFYPVFDFFAKGPPSIQYGFAGGREIYRQTADSIAGFGEVTIHPTSRLRFFVGARLTRDTQQARHTTYPTNGVYGIDGPVTTPIEVSGSTSGTNLSGRFGAQYDVFDDVMAYVTLGTGYKSPLVSDLAGNLRFARAETSEAAEIGVKSRFLNRRVLLNVDAFYTKYKDFQATVFDRQTAGFFFSNAGGLETKGAEIELKTKPTREISLNANVSWTPTEYTDYELGPDFNAAGYPLANAPKWTYTLSADYTRPVAGYRFDGHVGYYYRSSVFSQTADRTTRISGYGLVNLNLGIGDGDGRWRIGLFGRNLLDQFFVTSIYGNLVDLGQTQNLSYEAHRTVGVMLDVNF